MKKLTPRIITVALLLFVSFTKLSAQSTNSTSFQGVWELTQLASNNSETRVVVPGILKVFDAGGKFFNLRVTQYGSLINHKGNYVVNNADTYSEIIKNEAEDVKYSLAGKTYKLRYKFSDDKMLLVLKGILEGKEGVKSVEFTEVWKRVDAK